jgi:dTDP-4-dehydrorhamnose reductase
VTEPFWFPFDHLEKTINMTVSGDSAKILMMAWVQFFEQNGGKNYITTTIENIAEGKKYAITVQNCTGTETPAEKIARQGAVIVSLLERVKNLDYRIYHRPGTRGT